MSGDLENSIQVVIGCSPDERNPYMQFFLHEDGSIYAHPGYSNDAINLAIEVLRELADGLEAKANSKGKH